MGAIALGSQLQTAGSLTLQPRRFANEGVIGVLPANSPPFRPYPSLLARRRTIKAKMGLLGDELGTKGVATNL